LPAFRVAQPLSADAAGLPRRAREPFLAVNHTGTWISLMGFLSRITGLELGTGAADRWTVPDVIDFDYYVDEDERLLRDRPVERKRLNERDRALYREQIEPALKGLEEHTPRHRARALRCWLEARRWGEDPTLRPLLPGSVFASSRRLVTLLLGGLGFALGVGVASALLQYDGQHPVNVSWYLFWLVLLQILLATTTLVIWYARRTKAVQTAVADVSLLSHPLGRLLSRAARWVQHLRLAHLPNDLRDRAKARQGLVESHYALYGPASYLPMLILAQVFGIGFNVGAIVITIALEWFTDLAFGWASALSVSPETVHGLARMIATPWGWLFGAGVGYPTLEQVEGTRISLKDPLSILSAENLRSWRWFLVLAVFTYGLLPRLILVGLSVLKQRAVLAALPFTHQRTQGLYARMITPSLETALTGSGLGSAMAIPAPAESVTGRPAPPPAPRTARAPTIAPNACVLLIHVDVADLLEEGDHGRLRQMLLAHTGWSVAASATFGGGSAMWEKALALIEQSDWQAPPARVALVQDGSQPPITENLRFLRAVRAAAGVQAQVVLALIGDPERDDDPLPPLSAFDYADWQRKIEQMGDPYLRLEMLAIAENEAP
jgi:hypothetical protein